ncbi:hypothetical protein ACHAWC_000979 [Mediolabrus comicus]
MATSFSARRQAAIKQLSDSTKNAVATAVVAATLFTSQPSDAILVQNGGLDNNSNNKLFHSQLVAPSSNIQTINTDASSSINAFTSSIELSNSMANPMGEFKPETETGISPAFSTFGQWFFLLYVVVSLLAGGKEILGRIMKQVKDE